MRTVITALVLALAVTACGSAAHHAHHATAAGVLSASQGAQICDDLNSWLAGAVNEDEPRFTAQMSADEREAGDTDLGLHLEDLDTNLQELNGAALMPSPPGYYPSTGFAGLSADCAGYGVTVVQPGSQDG